MINFPPDDPIGRDLSALIQRLQYERYLASETDTIVTKAMNALVDLVVSGRYRSLTVAQKRRAAELYRELARVVERGYAQLITLHTDAMPDYAQTESTFTRDSILKLYERSGVSGVTLGPTLSPAYLRSIATLPIQGLQISDWFEAQARTMSLETKRIVQQGLIEGMDTMAIARRIVAPASTNGPVLIRRARTEARAISRTIVNAVQNSAQFQTMRSLPTSVSEAYVFEAVLDAKTTPICRALSGRVYRYDDPARKLPPQHISCRSSIRALLKGIDETITDQRGPRTLRTYDTWLRSQSTETQNRILGPTRATWWREGRLSLGDAIDSDSRVLTLAELRATLGRSAA